MRLLIPPYTNCIPLVEGLPHQIVKKFPSLLTHQSMENDLILAPIVTAFEEPGWFLLEGVGIGSFGPAQTVKLFMKNGKATPQDIKTIFLDGESKSSVALLKILLYYYFKMSLKTIDFSPRSKDACEAFLLIGDKTWEESSALHSYDLGALWTEWTGFPFVFACWMTKNKGVGLRAKDLLIRQAHANLEHLEELGGGEFQNRKRTISYWKTLCYDVGPLQKIGIELFQGYWMELGKKPFIELKWI